jgi:hypothetical protein
MSRVWWRLKTIDQEARLLDNCGVPVLDIPAPKANLCG